MLLNNRILYSDNGSLIDLSQSLGDYLTGTSTLPIVAIEDKIFIGSELPFNSRYFLIGTANDVASAISIDCWNGTEWKSAVDVLDNTAVGGKTLSQSGYIHFTPKRDQSWLIDDTRDDAGNIITGLTDITIYNLYWIRITFSGDLKATTSLKYVGYKFAGDSDLAVQYPDLNRSGLKTQFAGQSNWDNQFILASEQIVAELKRRQVIESGDQILDYRAYIDACVHKVAEMIMAGMGTDYEKKRALAHEKYLNALKLSIHPVDSNKTGCLEPSERSNRQGYLSR